MTASPDTIAALLASPTDAASHLALAEQHLQTGCAPAARQQFARARALGADRRSCELGIGIADLLDLNANNAVTHLQPLVDAGVTDAVAYLAAAVAFKGEQDRAAQLAQAIRVPPEPSACFWFAGALLTACRQEPAKAQANCAKALQCNGKFTPALLLSAQCHQNNSQLDQAKTV